MKKLRLGIIGIGNMGSSHCKSLLGGKVPSIELTAIADTVATKLDAFPEVPNRFATGTELIDSGTVDAVLVATPHYDHTTLGIAALEKGIHTLVEKPISVHKADCQRLIAAHEANPELVFAAMFNQRTDPYYIKTRKLIQSGELGEIRRVNWIITNWFRTEFYYSSGGWRATWAGEGGGVLLNQCPHNLDLFQWMFGMPTKVRSFCKLGRYHDIEVEDDVTAYMEFANGATGVFITSTGEAPGTNRLEITAERGKLVYEHDKLTFTRNEMPMSEFSRTTARGFANPETWNVQIPANGHGGQHNEILQNFADAVLEGKPLIAPAGEGIHSVELANAILFSSFLDRTIEVPIDAEAYETHLKKLASTSRVKGEPGAGASASDFAKSF